MQSKSGALVSNENETELHLHNFTKRNEVHNGIELNFILQLHIYTFADRPYTGISINNTAHTNALMMKIQNSTYYILDLLYQFEIFRTMHLNTMFALLVFSLLG